MKAIITLKDNTKYECQVKKDMNELTLIFLQDSSKSKCVPWSILKTGKFNVDFQPTEEEIGCGDCDTCLTPIC
jgi:hypothetical protein